MATDVEECRGHGTAECLLDQRGGQGCRRGGLETRLGLEQNLLRSRHDSRSKALPVDDPESFLKAFLFVVFVVFR